MSTVVWSRTKGWHDGPEVTVDVIRPLRPSVERARTFARIHAAAMRVEGSVTERVTGMCRGCGSVEVTLTKVTGSRDLSTIGESANYPTGPGCEVCS